MSQKTIQVFADVDCRDVLEVLLDKLGLDGVLVALAVDVRSRAKASPQNAAAWVEINDALCELSERAETLYMMQRRQDADARRKAREERIADAIAFIVVYDDGGTFDHLPSGEVNELLRAGIVETVRATGGGKSVAVTDKGREVYADAIAALETERAKDSAEREEARFPTVAVGPCASAWEYHSQHIPAPLADVVEVVFEDSVPGDAGFAEEDVVGIFRLRDGRYLYVSGGCDTTGWDCRSSASGEIRATLPEIVRECCTDDDRARMTQASGELAIVVRAAMPSKLTAVNE